MISNDVEIERDDMVQEMEQAERARSPAFENAAASKSEFWSFSQHQVLPMRRKSEIHIIAQLHTAAPTDAQLTGEPIPLQPIRANLNSDIPVLVA
jgi:hypothetical protein